MTIIVFDDDFNPPRYSRTGQMPVYDLPATFRAVVDSGAAVRGRVLLLQGPEQTVIATGEWSDGPKYELTVNEQPDPLKPLVVTVETDGDAWVIARAVYVGPAPDPTKPRWIASHTQKMRWDHMNKQGVGYVYWPGEQPQRSAAPYTHRPGQPWSNDAGASDFYVQRMTVANGQGDCFPEFVEHESGHIGATFARTQYHLGQERRPKGFQTGLFRDGPRNIGSVGFPAGGFVEADESLIVACGPGRIARIDTHGNVTTLFGWRLKPDAITPKHPDLYVDAFEFIGTVNGVGNKWSHIWDVKPHPDDPNILFVADAQGHAIWRCDRSTQEMEVFAGSGIGEADHVDAPGVDARFFKPRGVAFRDGWIYVGDDGNHAIRRISLATREVETVVESAEHGMHGSTNAAREWATDGAFGEAKFMHPQHVCFTSDGCLITPMHHQLQLVEFDLENRQVRTINDDLPGPSWRDQFNAWITLDIDDGSTGPVDTMYYNGWEHSTDRMYDREGNLAGPFALNFSKKAGAIIYAFSGSDTGFDQVAHRFRKNGYPQCAVVGRGAIWWCGVSGAGIFRITPLQEGESFDVDYDQYNRGREVWIESPDSLRPSLSLIHGPWGLNGYGNRTIDDLGRMTGEEFGQFLIDNDREDLTTEQVNDLFYFIQNESITARGLDDPDAAILPDEDVPVTEPPDDEEPEPEPDPEPLTALEHIQAAEASLAKAKEQL